MALVNSTSILHKCLNESLDVNSTQSWFKDNLKQRTLVNWYIDVAYDFLDMIEGKVNLIASSRKSTTRFEHEKTAESSLLIAQI